MYSKFNLELKSSDFEEYLECGRKLYAAIGEPLEANLKGSLDRFTQQSSIIDGSSLQNTWFPLNDHYDIFLSHSHQDEDLAIALSGFLKQECGLSVFIDSCLWGYSNDLLTMIDNEYCVNDSGSAYSYDKRNYSTSHVHMMLNIALNNMLDNCEAVFFLNTDKSLSIVEGIKSEKTMSPWIYSELSTINLLRQRDWEDYRKRNLSRLDEAIATESAKFALTIEYDVTDKLKKLVKIDKTTLENIKRTSLVEGFTSALFSLDKLYLATEIFKGKK